MPLLFYILFILFAVPLELHIYVWSGWGTERALRPLTEALVYFYAIILATETMFRMLHHREAFTRRGSFAMLGVSCAAVFFLFIVNYMAVLFPQISAGHHVDHSWWWLELFVVAIALLGSAMSYRTIERSRRVARPVSARQPAKNAGK